MGNNIINDIGTGIGKIDFFLSNNNYENADKTYQEVRSKILNLEKEEDIQKLINYLSDFIENKNKLKFQSLIANLRFKDKIPFLFQLIYENKLVDSIETIQNNGNIIINQKLSEEKDINKIKEEIENKMNNIIKVNKYIKLFYFYSILYEMISGKYYKLGSVNYSLFISKKEQKSEDLLEIIVEFTQCVDNYEKTYNEKIKLPNYKDSLEKVRAHYNILLGFEKIKEGKLEEALNYFNEVKYNNVTMIEEKSKGVYFCYEKLGALEAEKKNYEKAIFYYKKIEKDEKVFELNILFNEKKIMECIKANQYENSLNFFLEIFGSFNKARNIEYFEIKYNDIKVIFMELIIKIAIISYKEKRLKDYISLLCQLKNLINHKEMESKIDELLLELDIIQVKDSKENNNLFNYAKTSVLYEKNSEIKKRLYLNLILNYLVSHQNDTLEILINPSINLSYLARESFEKLKTYFKDSFNLNILFLISKIFYQLIVSLGLFNKIDDLQIIGIKILELIRLDNNQDDEKFNKTIENLILSFQEIFMNNKIIKSYNSYKNIYFKVISKNNKFMTCITRGLLLLSKGNVIFPNNMLEILKSYLLKMKIVIY